MWPNLQFSAALVIYTEEILNSKLHFLCSVYLHYYNVYDHKTWQDDNLPQLLFTHKVKWPYDHVVLWDHVTN